MMPLGLSRSLQLNNRCHRSDSSRFTASPRCWPGPAYRRLPIFQIAAAGSSDAPSPAGGSPAAGPAPGSGGPDQQAQAAALPAGAAGDGAAAPAVAPAAAGGSQGCAAASGGAAPASATPATPATSTPSPASAASPSTSTGASTSASTSTGTGGGTSSSASSGAANPTATPLGTAASSSSSPSSSSLPPFLRQLLSWFAALAAAVSQFPAWVRLQHLRRLREACEADPKDADKHAAYLSELVGANPREVVARVESRRFAVNGAVAAEYLKALIATGRVKELAKADAAEAAAASAAAASAARADEDAAAGAAAAEPPLPPPRTLSELLRDLQEQLASSPAAGAAAAGGEGGAALSSAAAAAAAGELPAVGSSGRRPLHVVITGVPPGALQTGTSAAAAAAAPAAKPLPLLLRPLAFMARLMGMAAVAVMLALAFVVGAQAIRRVQAAGGALTYPSSGLSAGAGPPVSSSAGGGNGASASSSGPGGGPSVDPKEYKKEEMSEKSIRTFKDVKGCDEAKEELKEVVEFLRNPTKFTRLGAKLPKGVLLTGPPGTGKTLLAKAVAGEAGVPFFYRAGSEFEELYVGVGSRRMRALFAAAKKKSPCIVFIDEIDAIGGNRKAWENHTRKTLNQLLVEMDGFEATEGVIVMAATNLPESLDPALKRPGRFDRQVAVPLPDIQGRRDILEHYLSDKPLSNDVDRELLARQTQGFSGADLSNLINEAAILAAKEGGDHLTQRGLDWAFDKVLMGLERKSVKRTLEARKRTAYHEAGHALVALATPGASPIHKATIVPRGHALGMVTQVGREDEFSINRRQMLARIRVCMGGTVAEELVFGQDAVSSGATDDLRQATSMARHMVAECGMSAAIGPVYVAAMHDERHGGGGVSEATRQRVDAEVAAMLAEAKREVFRLLTEREQDLHTLAGALLDKETLSREEIHSLLHMPPPAPEQPSSSGGGGAGGGSGGGGGDKREPIPEPEPAAAQAPASASASASTSTTASVAVAVQAAGPVASAVTVGETVATSARWRATVPAAVGMEASTSGYMEGVAGGAARLGLGGDDRGNAMGVAPSGSGRWQQQQPRAAAAEAAAAEAGPEGWSWRDGYRPPAASASPATASSSSQQQQQQQQQDRSGHQQAWEGRQWGEQQQQQYAGLRVEEYEGVSEDEIEPVLPRRQQEREAVEGQSLGWAQRR